MATNLFEKVQELQLQREKKNQEMMDFFSSLNGYGQVGYGIGAGLRRLFSDGEDTEMLQAKREDAYAKRVLMEENPEMQQKLLQGAFALSSELGQNLETKLAEERSAQVTALKTQMEMQKMQQEMAIALQEQRRKDLEAAQTMQRQFKAPSKETLAAATQFASDIDWEGMGYTQAPNKFQVYNMAGRMEYGLPAEQAMLAAMGAAPADRPIQDMYQDVRAKTDKQMSTTDVTNPKSLSDPTEY
jgi:hypothetical protein